MGIPLVLVSNRTPTEENYRREVGCGCIPRIDYMEIAAKLAGDVLGYNLSDASWYTKVLNIEKRMKLDLLEALSAASRSSEHSIFLSTSEKAAIPLSMFLALMPRKKPHILIGHHLSSRSKTRLFKFWKLHKSFAHIICVCRSQVDFAVRQLGFPSQKVHFVYDKVDQRFFHPLEMDVQDYILAVGQERRDYETLLRAVDGTGIKLVIVASSPWSTYKLEKESLQDVTVLSHIPYTELRELYARARLVVVPLLESDYAAGANAVLEAMAMAKPLILSRTEGIQDYVLDGETGDWVSPGNAEELKDAILHLWHRPSQQEQYGANARRAVEETMNLDNYVDQIVRIAVESFQ